MNVDFTEQLELRNEIIELSRLERFVAETARRIGLDERMMYLLNLACDELVTNIIMHGYRPEEQGLRFIWLDVRYAGGELELRLADEGSAFDPLSKPPPDVSLGVEERGIGGLGIHFVREIMDEVHYERVDGRRNILTMRKYHADGTIEEERNA